MAEINVSNTVGKRKSFSSVKTKRTTRVDLTPMVDLGFLLITFFVFTTSMTTSKVMDMDEPVDKGFKNIKASQALTILISKNHQLYFYEGELQEDELNKQIVKSNFKDIRDVILKKKKESDPKFLMYIIKSGPESTFGDEMNIIDEMLISSIPAGHYAEAELNEKEKAYLQTAN